MEAWKESADLGDACGQLLYGLCFFYGHGEDEDEDAAIEWFTKSAEQGNAQAQCSLGLCYENGWGCRENQNLANDWFKKAATQGHQNAIDELPLSLKVQLGIEPHKVLTNEIAEQFLADEDSVDLSEFTSIEDDAAESLSKQKGNVDLSGLTSRLSQLIQKLTGGRYERVNVDNATASRYSGVALPHDLLSEGTRSTVGLALRLSMASHFLEGLHGFLVLDDPMVDLDPERQQLTADVLKDFAKEKQVIVFTCHAAHAALLSDSPITLSRLA